MLNGIEIAKGWLPRYIGMSIDQFGDYVLLTSCGYYVSLFAAKFSCEIYGDNKPMQAATNTSGLSIFKFGIGSSNAATIMDLLIVRQPKAVLFLGKCGGLKTAIDLGHSILPIAATGGGGTSLDHFPSEVPALPSFKLHKFASEKILKHGHEYRTGVVYTTQMWVFQRDMDDCGDFFQGGPGHRKQEGHQAEVEADQGRSGLRDVCELCSHRHRADKETSVPCGCDRR